MESDTDIIYGIWSDADGRIGEIIQNYVQQHNKMKIVKVDVKQILMGTDVNKKDRYLVLLSGNLTNDHVVLVYLTQVLYRLHKNQQLTLTLVNVDAGLKGEDIPINLQALDVISAIELKEPQLHDIIQHLQQRRKIKDTLPVGNVGVGLAWSYFYGYLNLILPGLRERIKKATIVKDIDEQRIFKKFLILLPRSCLTPPSFKEVDSRFDSAGSLDDGLKRARAGQPKRNYKNFVQKIKGHDNKDFFFCGEFATPLLAIRKMLDDKDCAMDQEEMDKQMVLFKHTLMSILNHDQNKSCQDLTYILDYDDTDPAFKLYDKLLEVANLPSITQLDNLTNSSMSTFVFVETVGYYCGNNETDYLMERIQDFVADLTGFAAPLVFKSIQELLEYQGSSVDTALKKIFVALSSEQLAKYGPSIKQLVADNNKFKTTTFIFDFAQDAPIPEWLQETGADYISTTKDKEIWRRIMGSLFGTSTVEKDDNRWEVQTSEGVQYQVDRLPVGNVAEGLAWSYYHNYLTLIASSIPGRIRNSEYFEKGEMAKKMLILLPHSCFSYPTLNEADGNIEHVGKLQPMKRKIAGNDRTYNTDVHRITHGTKEYYACVEYCTPVLVLYEMEAERKAGLNKLEKEAQLALFYETLKRILGQCCAKECKEAFHFICYDDNKNTLSSIIIDAINKIN